jgi:MFS family permease
MLILGWVSDTYGRLPTVIIANVIALIAGIATPFATTYQAFIALRFLMGLSFNTFFVVPYILGIIRPVGLGLFNCLFPVLEYVESSKRTLVGNLGLALCLTLSGVYQPWLVR